MLEDTLLPAAQHIFDELRKRQVNCQKPEWVDYGYEIVASIDDLEYEVLISFDFDKFEWFELSYQPNYGFWWKLFGRDESPQMRKLSMALHEALQSKDGVVEIRWYEVPFGRKYKDHP